MTLTTGREPTWRSVGLPPNRVPGGLPAPDDLLVMYTEPWNDFFHPSREYEFATEKPDDDLFFPITSRTARGWYQVRSRHKRLTPHPALSGYQVRDVPITGADIPVEVIGRVMAVLDFDPNDPRSERQLKKRNLATCALVSRTWAPLCQRKIFSSVSLRCAADVHTLLSFLRAWNSRVREYILDLRIQPYRASEEPWIHHVASLYPYLSHRFPPYLTGHRAIDDGKPIPIVFQGPAARGQGRMRSIHQALPRRAPTFSNHIQRLCLSDVTFRGFNDLAHLVSELPDLHYLDCENLCIEGPKPSTPIALGETPCVTMTKCDYSWASIWLYKNRKPARRRDEHEERMDHADFTRIGSLASLIAAGFDSAEELVSTLESQSWVSSANDDSKATYCESSITSSCCLISD